MDDERKMDTLHADSTKLCDARELTRFAAVGEAPFPAMSEIFLRIILGFCAAYLQNAF